ncbi:glycosyltransferase [Arthrobacter psychrolactophilus]
MAGLLTHDWIERTGGSEKVLDALSEVFEDADIACLWSNASDRYPNRNVISSPLGWSRFSRHKTAMMPLMPLLWRAFPKRDYDWIISSSHQFSHHISRGKSGTKKLAYVHTPARYLWTPEYDPRGQKWYVKIVAPVFRFVDKRRARDIDAIAANSEFIRERIYAAWGLESKVIYPPVDSFKISAVNDWTQHLDEIELSMINSLPVEFILGASRLIKYKKLEDVIRMGRVAGIHVVIAGDGPDMERLQSLAKQNPLGVTFVGNVSDETLYSLYQKCVSYVFPAIEDFGIMPVEAMAAGASVIVMSLGGTAETVVDGVTGAYCDFDSDDTMKFALDSAKRCLPIDSKIRAGQFDIQIFKENILEWQKDAINEEI